MKDGEEKEPNNHGKKAGPSQAHFCSLIIGSLGGLLRYIIKGKVYQANRQSNDRLKDVLQWWII